MNKILYITFTSLVLLSVSCKQDKVVERPNIILIMADDMGYECLGSYGSTYKTPVLDSLAKSGIRFTNAISQPLCTPSRIKIMTGLRNYRNYTHFGYLGRDQRTIGHLMKDAGYATLIAGKWQLNGIAQNMPDAKDNTTPYKFGFDEYSLWQLTQARTKTTERYAYPLIEKNGEIIPQDPEIYGPDLFTDHIVDFIERKKDEPFFVYYPMVLVHDPFVPTPDLKEWVNTEQRYEQDTAYFKEMVTYTDKIVGRIVWKVNELGLDNTIIIFTGDNGTHPRIYTPTDHGVIRGDKGNTTNGGTNVPLVVHWFSKIKSGRVTDGLVEFTDFYATLAEITDQNNEVTNGVSFLNVLNGADDTKRETVMVYYDPHWGKRNNSNRNLFVRDKRYKLYQDGSFFDLENDALETSSLNVESLNPGAFKSYSILKNELDNGPKWTEVSVK